MVSRQIMTYVTSFPDRTWWQTRWVMHSTSCKAKCLELKSSWPNGRYRPSCIRIDIHSYVHELSINQIAVNMFVGLFDTQAPDLDAFLLQACGELVLEIRGSAAHLSFSRLRRSRESPDMKLGEVWFTQINIWHVYFIFCSRVIIWHPKFGSVPISFHVNMRCALVGVNSDIMRSKPYCGKFVRKKLIFIRFSGAWPGCLLVAS